MTGAACMGGWCARRNTCPLYRPGTSQPAAERRCLPGRDGELRPILPAQVVATAGTLVSRARFPEATP